MARGATAFMGITVAREHPGGSAPSTVPRWPVRCDVARELRSALDAPKMTAVAAAEEG
jgi:hypothetical protein